jgi:hypothetical protein
VWTYLSDVVAVSSFPTTADKNLVASVTTASFQPATSSTITATPVSDSYVEVTLNGVAYDVGSGVRTSDFYFSSDSGATARTIAAITAGDSLYVGSGLGFLLDATDRISLFYEI